MALNLAVGSIKNQRLPMHSFIPPQEIGFVDWVFNSSAVLRERASLMEQHEGLTYERDAARREPFALRSSYFVDELTS